jgi:flagellar basal body-associated protein FliL
MDKKQIKIKMNRETLFIIISVVLLLSVLAGAISGMGFVANEVTDALNPSLSGATPPVKFDLQAYQALNLGQ